jgi:1,2-diacylglycerol 3-beta-galactosyltransferase
LSKGGGHKASAKAIQAALDELYPGKFYCEITDIWTDYGSWPFNTFVEGYQWAAKNMWAWRMLYYYGAFPPTQFLTQKSADLRCFANFKGVILFVQCV